MTTRLNPFEEFLVRFGALEHAALGEPARVRTFWDQHAPIREAADALETFLYVADFERRVFHGPRKHWPQVPDQFIDAWKAYKDDWQPAISEARFGELNLSDLPVGLESVPTSGSAEPEARDDLWPIDPEFDETFDPVHHSGSAAIALGIARLEDDLAFHEMEFGELEIANADRIALGALDYLNTTIGLDFTDVFARWRRVPTTFMPSHVSNRHGLTEKGSLFDLLNDAARAYVFGAPAASIAMCRAAMEMILRQHYVRGADKEDLETIIELAGRRFKFIERDRLNEYRKAANKVLHDYSRQTRISPEDDRLIREFLRTVKFLIEHAPAGVG